VLLLGPRADREDRAIRYSQPQSKPRDEPFRHPPWFQSLVGWASARVQSRRWRCRTASSGDLHLTIQSLSLPTALARLASGMRGSRPRAMLAKLPSDALAAPPCCCCCCCCCCASGSGCGSVRWSRFRSAACRAKQQHIGTLRDPGIYMLARGCILAADREMQRTPRP